MKKIIGISHRFILLGVLVFGLGFLLFTDIGANKSQAVQYCCYADCIPWAEQEGCLDPDLGTPTEQCPLPVRYCWHHCSMSC